jgi:hypothetical protein
MLHSWRVVVRLKRVAELGYDDGTRVRIVARLWSNGGSSQQVLPFLKRNGAAHEPEALCGAPLGLTCAVLSQ